MRSNRIILISTSLLAVLSGCATSDFKPYSGAQQEWPTAPGGFIETKYAVPTYYGPPPRHYEILGYLDATAAPIRKRGVVRYASSRAKDLGGDAIIVLQEGAEYRGTYSSGEANTSAVSAATTKAIPSMAAGTRPHHTTVVPCHCSQ